MLHERTGSLGTCECAGRAVSPEADCAIRTIGNSMQSQENPLGEGHRLLVRDVDNVPYS